MALRVPEAAAAALADALAPLREREPRVRWLPADSLHLTVLFLGAMRESGVPELRDAIDATAGEQMPFEIRTGAGGGRIGPADRGGLGVAWLNLDRGGEETARLATALSERLRTGAAWPEKGHAPHLTVARRATRHLVTGLRDPAAVSAVSWTCREMVLFSSDLGQGAPRYDVLHVSPLLGA